MHIKFNDLFSQMQQQLEQPQAVLNGLINFFMVILF